MPVIGKIERLDFIIRDNATFKLSLTYQDPATGDVISLAGWDIDMQFRDRVGGNVLATFDTTNGFTIDAPNGAVLFKLQPTEIQAFPFNKGVYDIRVTDTIGDKDVWLEGTFEIAKGATYT